MKIISPKSAYRYYDWIEIQSGNFIHLKSQSRFLKNDMDKKIISVSNFKKNLIIKKIIQRGRLVIHENYLLDIFFLILEKFCVKIKSN